MNFAEKIKFVREKLSLSQTQMAKELGVSYVSVNRWENEQTKPTQLAILVFDNYCKEHKIEIEQEK